MNTTQLIDDIHQSRMKQAQIKARLLYAEREYLTARSRAYLAHVQHGHHQATAYANTDPFVIKVGEVVDTAQCDSYRQWADSSRLCQLLSVLTRTGGDGQTEPAPPAPESPPIVID